MPSDAECLGLPQAKPPFAFQPGEVLEFDLDALGALAGKMRISVRPVVDGALPIKVEAKTNTFFSKIRRVIGGATSYLNPKTLRPLRYVEEATENDVRKSATAVFRPERKGVELQWTWANRAGRTMLPYAADGLDVAGAIYAVRMLPLTVGAPICVDVYAIRRMWRLVGKVEAREHVSLPIGEFDAWHLSGVAIRTDNPKERREIHAWISTDARRLPLAAVGTMDLGAVRATLVAFSRPGEKRVRAADPIESLKW
jgi:hypothetical protein